MIAKSSTSCLTPVLYDLQRGIQYKEGLDEFWDDHLDEVTVDELGFEIPISVSAALAPLPAARPKIDLLPMFVAKNCRMFSRTCTATVSSSDLSDGGVRTKESLVFQICSGWLISVYWIDKPTRTNLLARMHNANHESTDPTRSVLFMCAAVVLQLFFLETAWHKRAI